jgi:translocator protein
MAFRTILFLLINFSALGIGAYLMDNGPSSDWYLQLNKAPWTPPGWMFGAAWTLIMICFAIFMSYAWDAASKRPTIFVLYSVQWILNTAWNPVFFRYQHSFLGLITIALLTILIAYILFDNLSHLKAKSFLIFPYFIWLLIATSLNAYIVINN